MKKFIALLVVQVVIASVSAEILWEETFDKNGSNLVEQKNGYWPYASGDASKNYVFTNYSNDYGTVKSYGVSVRSKQVNSHEYFSPCFFFTPNRGADQNYVELFKANLVEAHESMYLCFDISINNAEELEVNSLIVRVNDKDISVPTLNAKKLKTTKVCLPLPGENINKLYLAVDQLSTQLMILNLKVVDQMYYSISTFCQDGNGITTGDTTVAKNTSVQISAIPNSGFTFEQWSDGNTDNPRTITITSDTTFTASFQLSNNGQCGDSLYWSVEDGALTITGTGDMYDYDQQNNPWKLMSITFLSLSNGITTLGSMAFIYFSDITSLTIPESVTSIEMGAFAGCASLTSITCEATVPPTCGECVFMEVNTMIPLYVPASSIEAYQTADEWKNFGNILPITVNSMEDAVNKYVNTATRILRDGQMLILRDGKTYNMQGAVVE